MTAPTGSSPPPARVLRRLAYADQWLSATALALMVLVPVLELAARPLLGQGVDNAPVLVQHLGF